MDATSTTPGTVVRATAAPTPRKPTARPTPERTEEHAHLSLDALREYRKVLAAEESRVSYWRRILQARTPLYSRADVSIDTSGQDAASSLQALQTQLRQLPH